MVDVKIYNTRTAAPDVPTALLMDGIHCTSSLLFDDLDDNDRVEEVDEVVVMGLMK